ncbi:MAG: hypothetical protein RMK15_02335 [Chloroflexota bacterium]|jgi:hypothetical protein|nr:hypothetical protein [Chloroflexota bacterium]
MALLDKAKSLAGTLGKTAQKGATRAKLELEIRNLEGKLKQEYAQLGRVVYTQLKAGESVSASHPDIAASVRAIDDLQTELEETRQAIANLGSEDEGAAEGAATGSES